jgi:L-fuculose-phosphate aldolase
MEEHATSATARQRVAALGRQLVDQELSSGGDGSVSVHESDRIAITPAGRPHREVDPAEVALLGTDGSVVEDEEPTADWRLHAELIRNREDVGSVVYVHAPYASTFASLGEPIPASHYLIAFGGDVVPVAEYARPETPAVAENVLAALGDGYDACLVENDGLVAVGPNADAAVEVAVMIEYCARIHYQASNVGEPAVMSDDDVAELREIFLTYAGGKTDHDDSPVAPPAEDGLLAAERRQVTELGVRMLREGLTKGTGGNVSIRQGDHAAINPSGVPYEEIDPADVPLVTIDGEQVAGPQEASSETPMHTAIYRERPDVGSVIHTHSPYATTFASLDEPVPASNRRMAIVGDEIPVAGFEQPGTEALGELAVEALGDEHNACLLKNHGVMAVGADPETAYEVASLVEYCARVHYQALGVGDPTIVPHDELDALRERTSDASESD